jgi:hypothetical protein
VNSGLAGRHSICLFDSFEWKTSVTVRNFVGQFKPVVGLLNAELTQFAALPQQKRLQAKSENSANVIIWS